MLALELAPFRRHTRPVIESACSLYTDKDLKGRTLRGTVERLGPGHLRASTLHGWLGELEARAPGRLDGACGTMACCALIAETAKQLGAHVAQQWVAAGRQVVGKARSEPRADRLDACARLFDVTGEVRIAGKLFLVEKRWLDGRPRRLTRHGVMPSTAGRVRARRARRARE